MAPMSKNRSKNGRKLRIGPSLFIVICVFQLVVVWHWFRKALPKQSSNNMMISPLSTQKQERSRRDVVAMNKKVTTNEAPEEVQEQIIPPLLDKLWHQSSTLPTWIKDYFDWAVAQQELLTEENWNSSKYVVMQCLKSDDHCGGTSDRLKPIPLVILMAWRSKRILYIKWERPCALEEFLLPPELGYNWTLPSWLEPKLLHNPDTASRPRMNNKHFIHDSSRTDLTVMRARLQTFDGGSIYFNEVFNNTGISYESIYHDLFRMLFEPSPSVQTIIDSELSQVGLIPGKYATAHYRAFYAKKKPSENKIRSTAINAVECASQLRPGGPIYFASDSKFAIQSIQAYAQEHNRSVVVIENDEPLHLDKAESTNASDYYSVFVDLYLLGMGNCASVGMGGFGRYGLLLSYNATCWNRHSYNKQRLDCHWTDASETAIQ